MTDQTTLVELYRELQHYVGWKADDARRVRALAPVVAPAIPALVDDFYHEIGRHGETLKVITGGAAQIERLKTTLSNWLQELFLGEYNGVYVERRWRVGRRHVEISLDQIYVNAALSRLRSGLSVICRNYWRGTPEELTASLESLHKLLDLDLAIIENAYHTEQRNRQQRAEQIERVTERRELQSVLQDQEQRLRLLDAAIADLQEGIIITESELDWPGPRIVFVNEAVSRITGYAAEELIGKTPRVLQGPRSDHALMKDMKVALRAGRPFQGETINYRKGGEAYWLDFHIAPVQNGSGQVTHFVATHRDVSERRLSQEKLQQADRLAALGKAMAGLVHESRNALQRSQAGLERLARRVGDQPESLELIARIQQAQEDLHQLYEEVREYAAPVKINARILRIDECILEIWGHLALLREGRAVHLLEERDGIDTACEGDPFLLRRVIRNIFENSLAACEDPVEIRVLYQDARFRGAPALSLIIRDNGPGLNPEQQQRIFEEFYTTKTRGTGLGMAIARRIVEAHFGIIEARSAPQGGAEISITLPRKQL